MSLIKKWISKVLGLLFLVVGLIWLLQGIDTLKMSFRNGNAELAVIGAIAFIVGIIFIFFMGRKKFESD